jgi:hypothetical protein
MTCFDGLDGAVPEWQAKQDIVADIRLAGRVDRDPAIGRCSARNGLARRPVGAEEQAERRAMRKREGTAVGIEDRGGRPRGPRLVALGAGAAREASRVRRSMSFPGPTFSSIRAA